MTPGHAAALVRALAESSAFGATVPLLPYGATPRVVRAVLALSLVPLLLVQNDSLQSQSLSEAAINGAAIGAALGLSAGAIAAAVGAAGAMIDGVLGSPPFAERLAAGGPFAHLYQIAFGFVFLQSGGLAVLIARFVRASAQLPHLHSPSSLAMLARTSFDASLGLAGPSLLAQALATIVTGILARAAPQINGMIFNAPLTGAAVLVALSAGAIVFWSTIAGIAWQAALSSSFTR